MLRTRSTLVGSPDSELFSQVGEGRTVALTTCYLLSGGDVWPKQPAPADHPWRSMRNPKSGGGNAMVAHYSGTTLGESCILLCTVFATFQARLCFVMC